MKKVLALATIALALTAGPVLAAELSIAPKVTGSGVPHATGYTKANPELPYGTFYAPQYLPGYPTAATIWPRTIDVNCTQDKTLELKCDGYHWLPEYGRGEYLWVHPKYVKYVAPVPVPVVVKKISE